jgi:hypothetical protein
MSGGSRETEVNEPTTMPLGPAAGAFAVTAQTPVGYWPRTRRYHSASMTGVLESL